MSVVVTTPEVVTWSRSHAHLRRGEVRVERQSGQFLQPAGVLAEPVADLDGAAVLPDEAARQGPAGGAVPGQDGLALVRQGDDVDALARLGERGVAGVDDGGEQLVRVDLDVARCG